MNIEVPNDLQEAQWSVCNVHVKKWSKIVFWINAVCLSVFCTAMTIYIVAMIWVNYGHDDTNSDKGTANTMIIAILLLTLLVAVVEGAILLQLWSGLKTESKGPLLPFLVLNVIYTAACAFCLNPMALIVVCAFYLKYLFTMPCLKKASVMFSYPVYRCYRYFESKEVNELPMVVPAANYVEHEQPIPFAVA